jgi:urease accessory protein
MITDRLTLAQLLSPAFPIGSYAYSQGLEQAMTDGTVHDGQTLTDWVAAIMQHGSARTDAILAAHARHSDPQTLANLAYAYAASSERATEMRDQAAAFAQVLQTLTGTPQPPLPYAIALGHATRTLNLPTEEILALFLQSLAAQLISAAVRFLPLGASEGQFVLAKLAPLITQTAQTCAAAPVSALATSTLGADIAAMRHETLPVRIFRS